jgi:hypothetical protein
MNPLAKDIIDSWDDYEDLDDMPKSELCSYCFGARLRMMQASAYSVYDELFAEMLKHVNKGKLQDPYYALERSR